MGVFPSCFPDPVRSPTRGADTRGLRLLPGSCLHQTSPGGPAGGVRGTDGPVQLLLAQRLLTPCWPESHGAASVCPGGPTSPSKGGHPEQRVGGPGSGSLCPAAHHRPGVPGNTQRTAGWVRGLPWALHFLEPSGAFAAVDPTSDAAAGESGACGLLSLHTARRPAAQGLLTAVWGAGAKVEGVRV